jgi:hypothetical protein
MPLQVPIWPKAAPEYTNTIAIPNAAVLKTFRIDILSESAA